MEWLNYLDRVEVRAMPPRVSRKHQGGDLGEEVGGGVAVGWRSDLRGEIPDAEEPEAGWHDSWKHQDASLAGLPGKDGALPDRTVPALEKEPDHPAVLVVLVPNADPKSPLQGAP